MNGHAKIISLEFWNCYLITMRPYLLFVSGIAGLVGLSFAPKLSVSATLILFLVFFFSYGFGQAMTDCFQTDTDSISSPYRPLIQQKINKKDLLVVSALSLLLCGIVLAYYSISNLLLALIDIVGLATYTFFKRRWWGGPFYNGWIVAVLCLIGYNSGFAGSPIHFSPQFVSTLVAVLFGYANFVLIGYFKDVEADRATGYNTLVVKYGRKLSSVVSDVLAIVFVLSGVYSFYLIFNPVDYESAATMSFFILIAAIIISIYTQFQLHKVFDDNTAYKSVVPSIHTYILMFIAIASANRSQWTLPLIVFYIGFVLTITFRPERSQI